MGTLGGKGLIFHFMGLKLIQVLVYFNASNIFLYRVEKECYSGLHYDSFFFIKIFDATTEFIL